MSTCPEPQRLASGPDEQGGHDRPVGAECTVNRYWPSIHQLGRSPGCLALAWENRLSSAQPGEGALFLSLAQEIAMRCFMLCGLTGLLVLAGWRL